MSARSGACAILVALAADCTAHAGMGDRTWRELSTERIVLVTDVDADDARERLAEIDRLAAALADIYAAVQAQRRAIALMAESRGGVSSDVRARLHHYERAAAAR